uniref:Vesicle-fusing ATPase n=1 Tax=Rhizophora mucronata TaxID=61149 RepID=A0A2P2MAT6_RHIMU
MSVLPKVLYARVSKVVNGPEMMSKWIGELEKNIRELFNDADEDYRKYGNVIIMHVC